MYTEIFKIGKKEVLFHLLFWGLFFSMLLFAWSDNQLSPAITISRLGSWLVAMVLPIYINALILIPKYLNKTGWPKYLIFAFGILIIAKIFHTFFLMLPWMIEGLNFDFIPEFTKRFLRDFERLDKSLFSNTVMILGVSFAYRLGKDWVVNERVKEKLSSENLSMELALLKTQVNPHFLFNTLNNIYAIALEEKAISTADNISKLGTLMRYSLHDAQADFILLKKEIDYIERYIEMQKLRATDEDKINLNINIGSTEMNTQKIAPMILMPFIENAFKYGLNTAKESIIYVTIAFSEGVLSMKVQNLIHNSKSTTSGLGLNNVENRLKLIYPNRYTLRIETKENVHHANLEIKL